MEFFLAFLVGLMASGIVALYYEYGIRPKLTVFVDESLRSPGQLDGRSPYEFYHLNVSNLAALWPFPSRRPAWSTKVTMEVFDPDGNRSIPDKIVGRWPSHPEPLTQMLYDGKIVQIHDPAKHVAAQKVDVHSHEDEIFAVTLKYDGEEKCHIFSNESYLHNLWQHPDWALQEGEYRLRVTLYYERGREIRDFKLSNFGQGRSDIKLQPWQS
jgi:hypothetical protein